MDQTEEILSNAKNCRTIAATLSTHRKNTALFAIASHLESDAPKILKVNKTDIEQAQGYISGAMLDRLTLTEERIFTMAQGVRAVADLNDPVGRIFDRTVRKDGLKIEKISVPFGVVAIIYESRPNVTSDAAALCLKSGNVCILRSGKEAFLSARAIVASMQKALSECGLPENLISVLNDTSRLSAEKLMKARGFVDLLIPRGGAGLIRSCVEYATVPCIETGTGICHIYIDESADLKKALNIVENAKTSRPSVCNAAEVCLVHKKIAAEFLPLLKQRLVETRSSAGKTPVELRLDNAASAIISGATANEKDFDTEFLDYILSIGIVEDVHAAIKHIALHSTGHSECIVSENKNAIDTFLSLVDSAAVYVNASTRFTDGGEFGLGCEMGISTQKLHARGPLGLQELTSYKYRIIGDGHIR